MRPVGLFFALVAASLLVGCGGSSTSTPGSTVAPCAAGATEPCTADDGSPGTRACSATGDAWGSCAKGTGTVDWVTGELLGAPTDVGFLLSMVPGADLEAYVEVTPASGGTTVTTAVQTGKANVPMLFSVEGLTPSTRHTYRVLSKAVGTTAFVARPPRSVQTRRAPGESFTFTVQADSHLDDKSSVELYHRTLDLVAAAEPDFHLDLGDTFMCEKHSAPLTAEVKPAADEATVRARYLSEREHFDRMGHSTALFLVSGNHEGETGFGLNGTAQNLAVWATHARNDYYPNPFPGGFYTSSSLDEPIVGPRRNPYAWEWGDALFVVLDPFWFTTSKPKGDDRWAFTLGKAQYDWLEATLLGSKAKHKLVFAHHLVGGAASSRGGVEAAPYFEWGGKNLDGTEGFAAQRPGWKQPIHALFVQAGVSAFFHGHDHVYVHQELDGIVYQEVPQPSAANGTNAAQLAKEGGYVSGTVLGSSGHLRVRVTPTGATVEYVKSYLPADVAKGAVHGEVAHTYVLP